MSATPRRSDSSRSYPSYDAEGFGQARGEKTGFFHAEKHGDKWWLIDPNGFGFYGLGVGGTSYNAIRCEPTGRVPYHEFVSKKYGSEEAWSEVALQRLRDWKFNLLSGGASSTLCRRGLAHTAWYGAGDFVEKSDITPLTWWTGFPNVFSPDWPAHCDEKAREMCAPHRDDPWLIGYFLDNELQWWGVMEDGGSLDQAALLREALKKPADHSAKQAAVKLAESSFAAVDDFNAAWGTNHRSFAELAQSTEAPLATSEAAQQMGREFIRQIAELYFGETSRAIRRHDPNHMILGARIAEVGPDIWDISGRYCDVISINKYVDVDPERGISSEFVSFLRDIHEQAQKPILVSEWSFSALDSGLPLRWCVGMRYFTQEQRARAAAIFQETLLSLPFVVGTSWFMWVDEPEKGVMLAWPEDGNHGLVNEHDEPYEELTVAFADVHRRAGELHAAGALNTVYDPEPPPKWAHPLPQDADPVPDGPCRYTSGLLELIGTNGGLELHFTGKPASPLVPAIQLGKDPADTVPADTLQLTDIREDECFTVLEGVARGGEGRSASYAAGWRFWLPKSSCGWLGTQCVWVEDLGLDALDVSGLVHWEHNPGGPNSDRLMRSPVNIERFYLPLAAVDHVDAGVGFGVTTLEEGVEFVHSREEKGSSRCRQTLQVTVEPGQRFPLDGPVVVMFGYEYTEPAGRLAALKEQVDRVRAEVSAQVLTTKRA